MWQKLIGLFRKYKLERALVSEDCVVANLKRIHYTSLIGAAISLIHLALFLFSPEKATPALETWRMGIIFSHGTILVIMIAAYMSALYLKKAEKKEAAFHALYYGVIIVIMAAGVVIVSLDQLATSNITPFILACLITGTVFLIEPTRSLQIFLASYAAYYFAVAVAPQSAEQVLSNRVNGVASVGIGFALSMIMWRLNVTNILQKKRIAAQQRQLEQANRELEKLAYFDALTALPNRRYFDEILDKELALIELKGHESCLVMLDVDNFKNINDAYGHPAGDSLLVQLSHFLSRHIRKYDTLCRLGGDEFIILLPQTSLAEATAFAERIRECLSPCLFLLDSVTVRTTASMGVARLSGNRSETLARQYVDVDKALYLAKHSGRNCVRCAS